MRYKIELKYFYGWDDACWTEEINGVNKPLRFPSVKQAQEGLEEYFNEIKTAVVAGNMDKEEVRDDYRIVAANE